jgi:serine/threonine protein kinase
MLRDDPISEKVDLYGFGIMLWEMYTGKLPWSDKNYHQMIHTVAVRNERPPMSPDIPRELAKQIELSWHPVLLLVIYIYIK